MNSLISFARRQQLLQAFVDWLMEPIPFPGMTFEPLKQNSEVRA